jgi:hypothetical protein
VAESKIDHVNGFQSTEQHSIDYTDWLIRRTDWSWWHDEYQMPDIVALEGLPNGSIGTVNRSYFDSDSGLLAEVSSSTGDLNVGDAAAVRGLDPKKKSAKIAGPIQEVVVTNGAMAVSTKDGFYLATMSGATKLAAPKVAPLP